MKFWGQVDLKLEAYPATRPKLLVSNEIQPPTCLPAATPKRSPAKICCRHMPPTLLCEAETKTKTRYEIILTTHDDELK